MSEAIARTTERPHASAAATASAAAARSCARPRGSRPSRASTASRIGRLADAVGMSKSGLFAHFGSKEELQLATIETAERDLRRAGDRARAIAAPTGIERLRRFAENFLRHVEGDVFPGGCFFASVAAELDTRPGPVRDRRVGVVSEWYGLLEAAAAEAPGRGRDRPGRGSRAARVRARRVHAARERAVRGLAVAGTAGSCAPRDRAAARRGRARPRVGRAGGRGARVRESPKTGKPPTRRWPLGVARAYPQHSTPCRAGPDRRAVRPTQDSGDGEERYPCSDTRRLRASRCCTRCTMAGGGARPAARDVAHSCSAWSPARRWPACSVSRRTRPRPPTRQASRPST